MLNFFPYKTLVSFSPARALEFLARVVVGFGMLMLHRVVHYCYGLGGCLDPFVTQGCR